MRLPRLIASAAIIIAGCAPAPEPRTESARPSAEPTAAGFDVGPITSAQTYLEEPQYAEADLERGEILSLACVACHTLRADDDHMLGPNLNGMFGAAAGTKAGFDYSAALVGSGLVWTPRALDAWLAAPESFVPGTSMIFAGYASAEDRRDLTAYLLHATQAMAP